MKIRFLTDWGPYTQGQVVAVETLGAGEKRKSVFQITADKAEALLKGHTAVECREEE